MKKTSKNQVELQTYTDKLTNNKHYKRSILSTKLTTNIYTKLTNQSTIQIKAASPATKTSKHN
jgi:hypothetical protein